MVYRNEIRVQFLFFSSQVYEESVDYVIGIVSPITDWVDVELLPPAEYYMDRYLPELDPDQKTSKSKNFE